MNLHKLKIIELFFFFTPILCFTNESSSKLDIAKYTPWFTSPLLSPTPINMKPGHPAIEPSVTIFNTYGRYNSSWEVKKKEPIWAINPLVDFQFGITDNFGIETLAAFITNFKNGETSTHLQDTIIYFGYQLSNDVKNSWIPDCRFLLQETFPSGNYQKLNPKKEGIDSTGQGSYQTGAAIAFRKLFYLRENFFSLHWSIGYLFPFTVNVKGFNTYGGGFGTKGKVCPGKSLTAFLSGEYSINQNWVVAFDTEFFYQKKARFKGNPGISFMGEPANVGLPSSVQISFAPEVEYNFTSHSGFLAGLWFTIAGKNAAAFTSGFIAYLYVF